MKADPIRKHFSKLAWVLCSYLVLFTMGEVRSQDASTPHISQLRSFVHQKASTWRFQRTLPALQASLLNTPEVQASLRIPQSRDALGNPLMIEFKNGLSVSKLSFVGAIGQMSHPIKGIENEFIDRKMPADAHVAYFGPGSDLFRLVYDFPTAKYFHFYDVIDYWSPNKKIDLILEFQSAAKHLAVDGKITVKERGFLDHVPDEVMYSSNVGNSYFMEQLPLSPDLARPYLIKIGFGVANQVAREIFIHIHPIDFGNAKLVRRAMSELPDHGKTAAFIWGVTAPVPEDGEVLQLLAKKLRDNAGSLILIGRTDGASPNEQEIRIPVLAPDGLTPEVSLSSWVERLRSIRYRLEIGKVYAAQPLFVPLRFQFH